MEARKLKLNENQERAVSFYDVPATEFEGRDWFNDYNHVRALDYLLNYKKLPLKDAFEVLDKLDQHQAKGIFQGLARDEVIGLTKDEIDGIVKFGLANKDVKGLNQYQIDAFINLNNKGITADDLRKCTWLTSQQHVTALGYLLAIKQCDFADACQQLAELNKTQASAICYGLKADDFSELEDHGIKTLIKFKKLQGLQTKADLLHLNKDQIDMIKELYHWGLTSDVVRKHAWLTTKNHHFALAHLMKECFKDYNDAINEIKDLNEAQLEGVRIGLSSKEVKSLNKYQINALALCKTAKNQLSGDMFKDKDWFNSEKHVDALRHLIYWKNFTVQHAFEELDGLDSNQAKLIDRGESRDNIVGLNKWMAAAIDDNKIKGLTGKDLRGKDWFNSDAHVLALNRLLHQQFKFKESMLAPLEKLDQNQLKLISQGMNIEQIQQLTSIQIKILTERNSKFIFINTSSIEEATWLKTDEQYDAFVLLNEKMRYGINVLEILKQATLQNRVSDLLNDLKKPNSSQRPTVAPKIAQTPSQETGGFVFRMFSSLTGYGNISPQPDVTSRKQNSK